MILKICCIGLSFVFIINNEPSLIEKFSFFAALRGAATLKARALKEVLNIAVVLPAEKGISVGSCAKGNNGHSNRNYSGELALGEDFLTASSQELLAKGSVLLKRTRKGSNSVHCCKIKHLLEYDFKSYSLHFVYMQVTFIGKLSLFI